MSFDYVEEKKSNIMDDLFMQDMIMINISINLSLVVLIKIYFCKKCHQSLSNPVPPA